MPAPSAAAGPLPVGYYAENFRLVLDIAAERYDDLLLAHERAFHRGFLALSLPARRLYVRLVSRKGPLLRRDRLIYQEIPDLDRALAELAAAGYADDAPDAAPHELLALLLRAELAELAADSRLLGSDLLPSGTLRKGDLASLLLAGGDPARLTAAVRRRVHPVRPLGLETLTTFRLLFFGNLRQDWTELVLRDLGVVRYESYELLRHRRLFPCRRSLDDALHLRACRRRVGELLAEGDLEAAAAVAEEVRAGGDWHPGSRRLADAVLLAAGRALERAGEVRRALALYRAAAAPPARERRARLLARLGETARAEALCHEIAAEPHDETESVFAPRFLRRLRRRRGEALPPSEWPSRPRRRTVLPPGDGPVEQRALARLAEHGRCGFFSENWLWRSLFGLAFWDVVFAPVDGAFQHPFQYAPLDLRSADFRPAREQLITGRLAELAADPRPASRLLAVYDAKRGIANHLVPWQPELRSYLELALSRLTGGQIAWVCDRISRHPGRYGRGLPDLFVLRDPDPGFELFEVKAGGDRLRPEQGAWIDYLNRGGLPTAVLEVR